MPQWTPEQNKAAADALASYLRTGNREPGDQGRRDVGVARLAERGIYDLRGSVDQCDRDGGFLVDEGFITYMYEGPAIYAAWLTRSRWNILRRLLGRTCESCRSWRQLRGDSACRCAWGVGGSTPPWGKPFYPSAKASCRRWKKRGG